MKNIENLQQWQSNRQKKELIRWFGWFLMIATVVWAFKKLSDETLWFFLWDAPSQALDLGQRMFPPRWEYLPQLLAPVVETIHIATLGTLFALLIATPLAFLAARTTTPCMWLVRPAALMLIAGSRSVNSLIWALLFVIVLGPGPLAGIFAITFRSIGFIGKLLYEALEEINFQPIEALTAAAANPAQTFTYAVVPQIFPSFISITMFRWDINIREATVLGLVGAGGIGLQLQASLDTLTWPQVSLILLIILATVLWSEVITAWVRRAII